MLQFPAWDCQPYDRVSPHAGIVAQRMTALSRLARVTGRDKPAVLLATVNAVLQRVPAKDLIGKQALSAAPGNMLGMAGVMQWLELNGFIRASTVREPGDYAVRGGILDLFAPGMDLPVRLDFFGDTLETIRSFDPETQRTVFDMRGLDLVPVSEFQLTTETIRKFRTGYVATFGAAERDDMLYEAVSEGRRHPGMEHWLPLFHDRMDTLFDYLPGTPVVLEPLDEEAAGERLTQIADYYEARKEIVGDSGGPIYKPLPPARLYLTDKEWKARLEASALARLTPFAVPEAQDVIDVGARTGRNFAAERTDENANVFDAVVKHAQALAGRRASGSRSRCGATARATAWAMCCPITGLPTFPTSHSWPEALALPKPQIALAVLGLETGFETDGRRRHQRAGHPGRPPGAAAPRRQALREFHRRGRRACRPAISSFTSTTASAASSACRTSRRPARRTTAWRSTTPRDAKLFLPVENIELLSRYGSEETDVELDRLGGSGWQTRKARLKKRIREIAHELIKIAAERKLREAPRLAVGRTASTTSSRARFPYEETEDQQAAIDATVNDLDTGRPMDRLICGDVGFGKTEVALRAAFMTVMNGKQVAVVVPTTLLARQHTKTFTERFRGLPVQVGQASRLVTAADLKKVKEGLADGTLDIVVGTHALLGKAIRFKDLGLVVVDEEQHFGVAHKEKLKQLRAEVHVLTLTATPIPRTLQLALTGVRDLSIIASPPVDRLAVRTFVAPFDPLSVREALLRERYRGGQSFYVVPRIEDIAGVKDFLDKTVPEVTRRRRARPDAVDDAGRHHVGVLRRQVRRAAVDHHHRIRPRHPDRQHADRAPRRHVRALASSTSCAAGSGARSCAPSRCSRCRRCARSPAQAERRLKVLQSLDTLGAGFQLASHDLDIRGAGNLLGRRAVRPHQGGRLRALPGDAGRGGDSS